MEVGNKCRISAQYLDNYYCHSKKALGMGCEYHYSKSAMKISMLFHLCKEPETVFLGFVIQ